MSDFGQDFENPASDSFVGLDAAFTEEAGWLAVAAMLQVLDDEVRFLAEVLEAT